MEMLATSSASQKPFLQRVGRVIVLIVGALVILFIGLIMAGPGAFDLLVTLCLGWIQFLRRTVPAISWNWDLAGMAILCSGIILLMTHWFLNWLARSIAAARGFAWRWPWRWTWSGLVLIFVSFLVGMAVGGILHQLGWIAASPESLYEMKSGASGVGDMRQLSYGALVAMEDSNGDVAKARSNLQSTSGGYLYQPTGESPLLERYHVLLVLDQDGVEVGTIVFPRVVENRARARGFYQVGDQSDWFPLEELDQLILRHQTNLLSL